jgi:VanZ family protein
MLLVTLWSDQAVLPIDAPEVKWLLFNMQHRLAHLITFGLLGVLAGWAFEGHRRSFVLAVLLVSAFGAVDEYHQSLVPGRKPGLDDWLFDTFSAALMLYVWPRLSRVRPRLGAALGPVLVGAVFAVGIFLLARPHLSRPADLNRAALRSISTQVLTSARDVARQIRAAAG